LQLLATIVAKVTENNDAAMRSTALDMLFGALAQHNVRQFGDAKDFLRAAADKLPLSRMLEECTIEKKGTRAHALLFYAVTNAQLAEEMIGAPADARLAPCGTLHTRDTLTGAVFATISTYGATNDASDRAHNDLTRGLGRVVRALYALVRQKHGDSTDQQVLVDEFDRQQKAFDVAKFFRALLATSDTPSETPDDAAAERTSETDLVSYMVENDEAYDVGQLRAAVDDTVNNQNFTFTPFANYDGDRGLVATLMMYRCAIGALLAFQSLSKLARTIVLEERSALASVHDRPDDAAVDNSVSLIQHVFALEKALKTWCHLQDANHVAVGAGASLLLDTCSSISSLESLIHLNQLVRYQLMRPVRVTSLPPLYSRPLAIAFDETDQVCYVIVVSKPQLALVDASTIADAQTLYNLIVSIGTDRSDLVECIENVRTCEYESRARNEPLMECVGPEISVALGDPDEVYLAPMMAIGKPVVEEPIVEEPVVQVEQPTVEEPVVQVEQPAVKAPVVQVEQPAIKEAVVQVEQPAVEEAVVQVEQPVVKEPIVEEMVVPKSTEDVVEAMSTDDATKLPTSSVVPSGPSIDDQAARVDEAERRLAAVNRAEERLPNKGAIARQYKTVTEIARDEASIEALQFAILATRGMRKDTPKETGDDDGDDVDADQHQMTDDSDEAASPGDVAADSDDAKDGADSADDDNVDYVAIAAWRLLEDSESALIHWASTSEDANYDTMASFTVEPVDQDVEVLIGKMTPQMCDFYPWQTAEQALQLIDARPTDIWFALFNVSYNSLWGSIESPPSKEEWSAKVTARASYIVAAWKHNAHFVVHTRRPDGHTHFDKIHQFFYMPASKQVCQATLSAVMAPQVVQKYPWSTVAGFNTIYAEANEQTLYTDIDKKRASTNDRLQTKKRKSCAATVAGTSKQKRADLTDRNVEDARTESIFNQFVEEHSIAGIFYQPRDTIDGKRVRFCICNGPKYVGWVCVAEEDFLKIMWVRVQEFLTKEPVPQDILSKPFAEQNVLEIKLAF